MCVKVENKIDLCSTVKALIIHEFQHFLDTTTSKIREWLVLQHDEF